MAKTSIIADIGSGTGISAKLFLELGCMVYAVEPNREMRETAEKLLSPFSTYQSVDGTAQTTTLPHQSVDFIVAAQAFHWFNTAETRAEFSRILQPGGHLVLVWNERKLDSTSFLRDYEQLLLCFGTDYAKVRHENINPAALDRFFIGSYAKHVFTNEQRFDFEGLRGRLLSSSYAPASGQPGHEEMITELKRIYELHEDGGQVCFEYDTVVYLGR